MSAHRLPEQQRVRREKAERLRARGIDPYPVTYPRTHTLAAGPRRGRRPPARHRDRAARVSVTGRRDPQAGRRASSGFGTLRDGSGDLQVMVGARRRERRRTSSCGGTTSTWATTSASPAR